MNELRSVDPRSLHSSRDNPRKSPVPPMMDEQLIASIRAIGIIQPPIVREIDGNLVIKAGQRRVKAAIALDLPLIDVIVRNSDDAAAPMESLSENLVRAAMNNVDIWRAIQSLEGHGWNEQAIADALAQPLRTVRRLKLLARLHPPMLEVMAKGNMPSEDKLRTIAAASLEEQTQVWKKYKPKKGEDLYWNQLAHALSKRRIPFSAAKFGEDLASAYGVVWLDDLFAPAGEDGRYTTNVDGFFGAQQEWLANSLPEKGTLLTQDDYGRPVLPKKAEYVHGKPTKGDVIGHYLEPHSGEVKTVTYRMPAAAKPAKGAKTADTPEPAVEKKSRPDVTQKGNAIIGDLRTDALHEALRAEQIEDATLIALLVLAFGGKNVSVQSGVSDGHVDRARLCKPLIEGGVLTADHAAIRTAAREMLVATLSCRDNMSNSGVGARVAGDTIGASLRLPSMATEEFLSCLSRQALEAEARTNAVRIEARVKDTRAEMIKRFSGATWHYPGALFALTEAEIASGITSSSRYVPGNTQANWDEDATDTGDEGVIDGPEHQNDDLDPNDFAAAAD
jgi:ParB family chromosome partitioning protein